MVECSTSGLRLRNARGTDTLEGRAADVSWELGAEATSEVILQMLKNVLEMQTMPKGTMHCCQPDVGSQKSQHRQGSLYRHP